MPAVPLIAIHGVARALPRCTRHFVTCENHGAFVPASSVRVERRVRGDKDKAASCYSASCMARIRGLNCYSPVCRRARASELATEEAAATGKAKSAQAAAGRAEAGPDVRGVHATVDAAIAKIVAVAIPSMKTNYLDPNQYAWPLAVLAMRTRPALPSCFAVQNVCATRPSLQTPATQTPLPRRYLIVVNGTATVERTIFEFGNFDFSVCRDLGEQDTYTIARMPKKGVLQSSTDYRKQLEGWLQKALLLLKALPASDEFLHLRGQILGFVGVYIEREGGGGASSSC